MAGVTSTTCSKSNGEVVSVTMVSTALAARASLIRCSPSTRNKPVSSRCFFLCSSAQFFIFAFCNELIFSIVIIIPHLFRSDNFKQRCRCIINLLFLCPNTLIYFCIYLNIPKTNFFKSLLIPRRTLCYSHW